MRLGHENPIEYQSHGAVCKNCGRDFKTDEYTRTDGPDHWCSDACWDEWDLGRQIECTGCGKIHGAESCHEHALNEAEYKAP